MYYYSIRLSYKNYPFDSGHVFYAKSEEDAWAIRDEKNVVGLPDSKHLPPIPKEGLIVDREKSHIMKLSNDNPVIEKRKKGIGGKIWKRE